MRGLDVLLYICRIRSVRRTQSTNRVVATLAQNPAEWRHGYAIIKQTGVHSGTLYPILQRLVEHDLLESKWGEATAVGRPARHLYRLTAAGLEWARSDASSSTAQTGFRVGVAQ